MELKVNLAWSTEYRWPLIFCMHTYSVCVREAFCMCVHALHVFECVCTSAIKARQLSGQVINQNVTSAKLNHKQKNATFIFTKSKFKKQWE